MTLDDDSSIYVGGLPYDASEDTIRTVFNLYGAIVDVKIINDQRTRGKCYCFVTFTNPRSALDAINDMNGRASDIVAMYQTIGGRVVKVNGVNTRGGTGRSNFSRERHYYHNDERSGDWDRGRDRDRDHDYGHDRDGYRNRSSDWTRHRDRSQDRQNRSRDRDRDRDRERDRDRRIEHMQDYDRVREPMVDDYWDRKDDRAENQQESGRVHGADVDRGHNVDLDTDRKMDRISDPDKSSDEHKKEESKRIERIDDLNVTNQHSMDVPSDSDGDRNDQLEDQLERSMQRLNQLKKEVSQMEEGLDEKCSNVAELQKQSKKLEEALISAKKHSSYRQMQLTKLHRCFLQVKDSTERLKTSEKELQALVETVMFESDGDGDGQLTNGSVEAR